MYLLKKLYSPFLFSVGTFFLLYVFYRSEIYWEGNKRNYYYIYYYSSIALIIFSIATKYLNDKIREYLVIITLSVVFGLYFCELYLTIKNKLEYFFYTGDNFDTRTRYQIYQDLKKIDKDVTIAVAPHFYLREDVDFFPLSGKANLKTIHCNEIGYFAIYDSDRYGFNNPDYEWESSTTEYLLIGDSYVHGACINPPHDIASVLRKNSNKSVLNLAYRANGPLLELATLKEYIKPNTKKILWFFSEVNDFENLNYELNNKILIKYLDNTNFTQNQKKNINKINFLADEIINKKLANEKIEENSLKFKVFKFIKIFNVRWLIKGFFLPPPNYKIQADKFREILQQAKKISEKNNSKLYFIYLPEYSRYKKNYKNTNYLIVKSIVNDLNIPFIDIDKEVFQKTNNPIKYFPYNRSDYHYTEEAYQKIGLSVYNNTYSE